MEEDLCVLHDESCHTKGFLRTTTAAVESEERGSQPLRSLGGLPKGHLRRFQAGLHGITRQLLGPPSWMVEISSPPNGETFSDQGCAKYRVNN